MMLDETSPAACPALDGAVDSHPWVPGPNVLGSGRARLILRQPGRAARNVDRHREPDADKDVLLGGVHETGHDAHDVSVAIKQGPAGVSGIDGGVDLNQALQRSSAAGGLK